MDLSDPKTWTDGVAVVASAPHIIAPLLIAVVGGVWWVRGKFDQSKIDGLQHRLDGAKEQQSYLTKKLDDAQAEIAKLQPLLDKAVPETLSATINKTLRYVREAAVANTDLGNTISKVKVDPPRIFWRRGGSDT
jgi:hypothetical protein